MTDRRGGLGRGLGALIPTGPRRMEDRPADMFFATRVAAAASTSAPAIDANVPRETEPAALVPVDGARYVELPIDAIRPNPRQPRQVFDDDALAELVASIREVGLLQPVVVRSTGSEQYELVMGERRWRASRDAGLSTVPAIVRSTADDAMLRDALLENLHRAQLSPLEEAAAYRQLLDDFGCTHDELAGRIGRSRPQVSNTLRLLKLPPTVQRRVAAGVLSAGHARALLSLDDADAQERLASRIVAEGLSVRSVEEIAVLGGPSATRQRGARAPRVLQPEVRELADALSDRFDTRVQVDLGRRKGRIVVEFATWEDLQRIVALMDPAEQQHPHPGGHADEAIAVASWDVGSPAAEDRPTTAGTAPTPTPHDDVSG